LALAAAWFGLLPTVSPAQFTPGNLVVLQIGDGSALSANGNGVQLLQFTPGGTAGPVLSFPTTGPSAVRLSGTATSEGFLSNSPNGQLVNFAAYREGALTFPSAVSLPGSAATDYPRTGVSVAFDSTVTLTTLTGQFAAGNPRSAVGDGTNLWAAGSNTGIVLAPNTVISTTNTTNNRVINISNNNLTYSTGAGTTRGIWTFAGTPTAAATPTNLISTGATSSPYGFAINPAGNLAYVADDRATTAGGGIQRWDLVGATWTNTYTLTTGLTAGVRGLAVDFSGANPVLYGIDAAAAPNNLIKFTDIGAGSAAMTLASAAGANFVFRGIAFSPVPEPATILGACAAGAGVLGFVRRLRRKPAAD
jgi:hypothetical protein